MTLACNSCGSEDIRTVYTTRTHRGIRRRRECNECKNRFTTLEVMEQSSRFGRKKSYSHLLDLYWELHQLLLSADLLKVPTPRRKMGQDPPDIRPFPTAPGSEKNG